jgi:predicted DNA-binding transcriptional regulator AlpA
MIMNSERLIPIGEVATVLHVSTRSIHKWLSAGRFPQPIRLGRALRWRASDLHRFIGCGCDMSRFDAESARAAT